MIVALVRLSALGDLCQVLGAVRALAAARPGWRLHLCVQDALAPLLDGIPGVAEPVLHDRRAGVRGYWRTMRALRRLRCDAAVDLQGNFKSAGLVAGSGARIRLGAAARARREPLSALLVRRRIVPRSPGAAVARGAAPIHPAVVARSLLAELAPLGPAPAPVLVASEAEVEAERAALRALGVEAAAELRAVVLRDPADPRALQAPAFAGPGPVVALAGPAERTVEPPAGVPVLRHGPRELRRLVAFGALVARCGGEVIGPDVGATHVLAAAGARCTALFGPQDPAATAPPEGAVLVHPAPPPCAPCRRRTCHHAAGPVCMAFGPAAGRPWPPPDRAGAAGR